jgi:uncharacterized membrane protein
MAALRALLAGVERRQSLDCTEKGHTAPVVLKSNLSRGYPVIPRNSFLTQSGLPVLCLGAALAVLLLAGCDSAAIEDPELANSPPQLVLSQPGAISVAGQPQITVRGTVTHAVGVTRLAYALNGDDLQDVQISSAATVDFEFVVHALEPGSNTLTVTAFAGDKEASVERHVSYAVVRYQVVVAGEFGEGESRPRAINASGDVALQWESRDVRSAQGFVWSDGALTELVLPDGHILMGVSGINAARAVVGDLEDVGTGAGDWRDVPVLWENGQPHVLPLLDGFTMGGAQAINDAGTIAGFVMDDGWDNWAAVAWIDGQPTRLVTGNGVAADINSSGVITGASNRRAFRWQNGETTALEPLGGYNGSAGFAINANGDIVGYSYRTGQEYQHGNTRATLWRGSTASSLGEMPGGRYYRAFGINDHGQAVGEVDMQQEQWYHPAAAFLSQNGRMSLLNHLTDGQWHIIVAYDINDAGQIAAYAVNRVGSVRAVRLDPVQGGAAVAAASISLAQESVGMKFDPATLDRLRPRSALDRMREGRSAR